MKSDAMTSRMFPQTLRQDRTDGSTAGRKTALAATGTGSNDDVVAAFDFRAVYNKIATTNSRAQRITDASTMLQEQRRASEEYVRRANEVSDYTASLADHVEKQRDDNRVSTRRANSQRDDDDRPSRLQANRVIGRALTEVSEKLGLRIPAELKELSIDNVSPETVEQLAEIMSALKNIAGLFNEAVAKGQSIELGSGVIDPAKAREMASFVQSMLFKVEIGANMLGAGDQVRDLLSGKMVQSATSNIPQALDPAQISMSQAHTQRVFGDMLKDPSSNLAMLVQKIRDLCAEAQGQNNGINLKLVTGSPAESAPLPAFDSPIMRALLKIDGRMSVAGENMAAAKNQTFTLSLDGATFLHTAGESAKGTGETIVSLEAGKGLGGPNIASVEGKLTAPVYRTLDESVMRQIADKMSQAWRNGLHEVRIQLRPQTLGDVQLRIRVEGDVVFAKIQVENNQVKQIVENNLQFLRDSLSQQNLQAGSLEVNVGGEGFTSNSDREVAATEAETRDQTGDADTASGTENADVTALGDETGRRFGDNTVEYFM